MTVPTDMVSTPALPAARCPGCAADLAESIAARNSTPAAPAESSCPACGVNFRWDDVLNAAAIEAATPWSVSGVVKRLGPAAVLAVIAAVLPPLGSIALFVYIDDVGAWLRTHGDLGPFIYSAAFAVLAGLALLPTYASAILGGWAFGFALGFPAALAGFFGGSLIGYGVARTFTRDRVNAVIAQNQKMAAVRQALIGGSFWRTLGIVTLLRLPINSPFAITNLVLASVKVRPLVYVMGTLVGMAPRTGLVVYLAESVRGMVASEAARSAKPWWVIALGIGLALVVLLVISQIASRALKRVTGPGPTSTANVVAAPPGQPSARGAALDDDAKAR